MIPSDAITVPPGHQECHERRFQEAGRMVDHGSRRRDGTVEHLGDRHTEENFCQNGTAQMDVGKKREHLELYPYLYEAAILPYHRNATARVAAEDMVPTAVRYAVTVVAYNLHGFSEMAHLRGHTEVSSR